MKKLFLISAAAISTLRGQTLQIVGPNNSIKSGSQVTLNITLSGTNNSSPSALQFTIPSFPYSITATTQVPNKSITCATINGNFNCILFGFNSIPLTDGQIASLVFTLLKNSGPQLSLALNNTLGAAGDGTSIAVGGGSPFVLNIINPCDINSDGIINQTDFNLVLPQYLGQTACTSGDLNSDGACNILDVQILSAAVGGGTCNAK